MSIEPRKRMQVEDLRLTQEFQRLTQKQQLFVVTYCAGGLLDGNYDPIEATRTAYQCKNAEVARIMSYSVMANIKIVAVLNRHFNTEPIEEFLVLVDRAIHNKKLTIAQLQALRLKCDVMGYATRSIPSKNAPTGVVPEDVLDASREARKEARRAKRKISPKPPPPEKPSEYSLE